MLIAYLTLQQVLRPVSQILLQQLQKLDRWQAFDNHTWSLNRWLSVRFELISLLLLACVGCAGLLLGSYRMPVGYTGFLLTATTRAYQEGELSFACICGADNTDTSTDWLL